MTRLTQGDVERLMGIADEHAREMLVTTPELVLDAERKYRELWRAEPPEADGGTAPGNRQNSTTS